MDRLTEPDEASEEACGCCHIRVDQLCEECGECCCWCECDDEIN